MCVYGCRILGFAIRICIFSPFITWFCLVEMGIELEPISLLGSEAIRIACVFMVVGF
jgi:hypothetical protein